MPVLGRSAAASGVGQSPDGFPADEASAVRDAPLWVPSNVSAGDFDVLFDADPYDEKTVLAEGGTLQGNPLTVFADPPPAKATLAVGKRIRKASTTIASGGALSYPVDGVLPLDEWTIECWAQAIGVDASTLGVSYIWSAFTGSQSITILTAPTGLLQVNVAIDERTMTSGVLYSYTAQITLASGDIPADTWRKISVTWDGTTMRLILGDNAKSGTIAMPTTNMTRPWSGDPRQQAGHVYAGNTSSGQGVGKWLVGDLRILRYARTYNTAKTAKPATITVDAGTAQGAFPRAVFGVVTSYSDLTWDDTDALTSVRDAQHAVLTAAGVPFIRMGQFSRSAIPAGLSGDTVATIDYTKFDNIWGRAAGTGADLHMTIGNTPTVLGATEATVPTNSLAFADYISKVITHVKAQSYGSRLVSLSFWNEPELGSWGGTINQFASLWLAVAQRLAIDHSDLPLGGINGLWALSNGTAAQYQKAVIDIAAANALPMPALYLHDYMHNLCSTRQYMADMRQYAATKGYPNVPVQVSEWNYELGAGDTNPIALHMLEFRRQTVFDAAYAHAHQVEAIAGGSTNGAFYRMGEHASFDYHCGLLSRDAIPKAAPVFGALQLCWKHSGNRVSAVSNWPNLRTLASKTAGGVIHLTYSRFRTWRQAEVLPFNIDWTGLPSTFTWKQWRVDYRNPAGQGRPILVAAGDQSNLPRTVDTTAVGMGAIQVTPA